MDMVRGENFVIRKFFWFRDILDVEKVDMWRHFGCREIIEWRNFGYGEIFDMEKFGMWRIDNIIHTLLQ